MRRIVQNGHCWHLIIDNQSPEAVALVEAILDADHLVMRPGSAITTAEITAVYEAIARAEASWCRAHNFREDRTLMMALARLTDNLHRHEARHASA